MSEQDAEIDARLADDRPVTYTVTTVDGRTRRWTGTAALLNQRIKVRSGPMLLLCDNGALVNFAHVVSLEPIGGTNR